MLKIRRPLGRLIFNMGIAIPGKTVFLIEMAPWTRDRSILKLCVLNSFWKYKILFTFYTNPPHWCRADNWNPLVMVHKGQFIPSPWRHDKRDGVSNHRRLDYLLNRLFRRRSRKRQSSVSLVFVRGIHRRPVNSTHKGPVTRNMFPFDDVIML